MRCTMRVSQTLRSRRLPLVTVPTLCALLAVPIGMALPIKRALVVEVRKGMALPLRRDVVMG